MEMLPLKGSGVLQIVVIILLSFCWRS